MWLQTVLGTACLLAATQATVIISDDVVGDGDGNFNFEVLGSLCFAPNTLASVRVQTNAIGSGIVPTGSLVVYTQNSLHSLFNSGSNCEDQSVRLEFLLRILHWLPLIARRGLLAPPIFAPDCVA